MLSQLSGCIGHYSSFLHKDTSETLTRCITINRKVLAQIWQNQYWGCSQPLLQFLKVSLALLRPHKLSILLQQSCHRLGKFRKAFYEPSIVSGQSLETSNLSHIDRWLPVQHISHLAWIYCYSTIGDNMA